jgi:hypothetical protein
MQLTSLSTIFRVIGFITIFSAIGCTKTVQATKAQPAGKPGSVCSDAYFANPDFMYSVQPSGKQQELLNKFGSDPVRMKRMKDILAKSKTFSVALDAPVGYVVKNVNGKAVEIPPKIAKDIYWAAFNANRHPKGARKRAAELNQKYAQYATFGQQLNLIFSPEQIKENTKMTREASAYLASVLTPQQKQQEQEYIRAGAAQQGMCPALFNPDSMRYVTIQVGERPDLDKRLREDTTGATFFK